MQGASKFDREVNTKQSTKQYQSNLILWKHYKIVKYLWTGKTIITIHSTHEGNLKKALCFSGLLQV